MLDILENILEYRALCKEIERNKNKVYLRNQSLIFSTQVEASLPFFYCIIFIILYMSVILFSFLLLKFKQFLNLLSFIYFVFTLVHLR